MTLNVPMRNGIPVKTDWSGYSDDDDQYRQYDPEEDQGELCIANDEHVNSFILACRCSDEDFDKWQRLMNKDTWRVDNRRNRTEEFLKVANLNPEPVRAKILCRMLQSGALVMATEITSYFVIIHIGNDFTQLLKRKLKECRDNSRCTFTVTNKAFAAQRASRCRTCFGDDLGMAIYDNCIACCHKGHDTYIVVQNKGDGIHSVAKTLMYCDCGYKLPCKLLD